jgi:hypothetical protein
MSNIAPFKPMPIKAATAFLYDSCSADILIAASGSAPPYPNLYITFGVFAAFPIIGINPTTIHFLIIGLGLSGR